MLLRRLALSLSLLSSAAVAQELSGGAKELVEGNDAFACDLYKRLAEREGNRVVSPYSISVALSMTAGGARGQTAQEMGAVLRLPAELAPPALAAAFGELQRGWGTAPQPAAGGGVVDRLGGGTGAPAAGGSPGVELVSANALWLDRSSRVLPAFSDLLTKGYQAGLTNLDFRGATEESRRHINAWIESGTQGRVKELIRQLSPDTGLVLTNVVYFKGAWTTPFDPKDTKADQPFTLADGSTRPVALMFRKGEALYAEVGGVQAVQLSYGDQDRASMLVLLPPAGGMAALEQQLSPGYLAQVRGALAKKKVQLHLPRIAVGSTLELSRLLAAMGMKSAFGAGADFSGIDGQRRQVISQVLHGARVEVDEVGTVAAAATAVLMTRGLSMDPVFRADRPFLFLIRDHRTGTILFLGRVSAPD